MAEGYFAWKITEVANRAPRKRTHEDGFQLDETDFVQLFRLSKDAARTVCEDLRPYLTPSSWRADSLSVETKVRLSSAFRNADTY